MIEETKCNGLQQHQHHTKPQAFFENYQHCLPNKLTAAFKKDKKQRRVLGWNMKCHVCHALKNKNIFNVLSVERELINGSALL